MDDEDNDNNQEGDKDSEEETPLEPTLRRSTSESLRRISGDGSNGRSDTVLAINF
jgi:hypothetical protein